MNEKKEEKNWQLTKKVYKANVRLTAPIYDAVLQSLKTGAYLNLSECINDLLKQYFNERGVKLEAITPSRGKKDEKELEVPADEMLQETVIINARIPVPMKDAINSVLDAGLHFNISHYIREAVKNDLETRGIINI